MPFVIEDSVSGDYFAGWKIGEKMTPIWADQRILIFKKMSDAQKQKREILHLKKRRKFKCNPVIKKIGGLNG